MAKRQRKEQAGACCQECRREIARLHKFILTLAERLAAASEILGHLAEKKSLQAQEERGDLPGVFTRCKEG